MTLVVEDGSNVPGANSYASADDLYLHASERNITIPTDIGEIEALLLKGMDYLETLTPRFKGLPKYTTQRLAFPRTVQDEFSYQVVDLGVPDALKKAQIVVAIASMTTDLMPVQTGSEMDTIRQTVGPITVEYEKASRGMTSRVPQADALLRPFFTGGFGQPTVIRG